MNRRGSRRGGPSRGGTVAAGLILLVAVLARKIARPAGPARSSGAAPPAPPAPATARATAGDQLVVAGLPPDTAPRPPGATPWRARARRAAPDLAFAAVCAVVAAWRFSVLTSGGAPPGVDSGNWIALGRDLLGAPLRSTTIVYPPLVPLAVTGAVGALGLVDGVASVIAASSILAGAAAHVVLRHCGLTWAATGLATLLVAGSATGEAAAWGGVPQMASLGAVVLFVWALDRFLREHRLRMAGAAGVLLAVVLATSHLVAFAALLCAAALVVVHGLVERPWRSAGMGRLVTGALLVITPCLPLAPLYAELAGGLDTAPASDRGLVLLGRENLLGNVDFLFRDFAVLWRLGVTAALAMPILLWHRRRTPAWSIATSVLIGTGLALLLTRQSRFLYLLPVATVLALAVWAQEMGRVVRTWAPGRARLVAGVASAAVLVQLALGLNFFTLQREYYAVLDGDLLAGITWLRDATPAEASVAVTTGRHDHLLGWWVEGVGRRRALFASRLVWLNFDDERERAGMANALFAGGFPTASGLATVRREGVDYVMMAKAWSGFDAEALTRFRARHPERVAYENRSVVVLEVR